MAGKAGFVGSHLVRGLLAKDYNAIVLDNFDLNFYEAMI